MAVETKIGLVVGLGFITCFAVVLSHRGSGDQLSARMAYDVLSKQSVTAPPESVVPPETYARRQARERQVNDTRSKRRNEARESQRRGSSPSVTGKRSTGAKRRSSTASSGERNKNVARSQGRKHAKDGSSQRGLVGKPALRGGAAARRNSASKKRTRAEDGVKRHQVARHAERTARQSGKGLPSFEALFGGGAGDGDGKQKDAKRQADLKAARHAATRRAPKQTTKTTKTTKRPGRTGVNGRAPNRATTSREKIASRAGDVPGVAKNAASAKKAPTERKTRKKPAASDVKIDRKPAPAPPAKYVVKPKDTLWHISERMYGVGSRKIVDAILAANKDRLTSAKRLRVGVELVLPVIDGVGAAKLARKPRAQKTSKLVSASQRPRYYQIQNGDRYSTIAERFLGSKSRWKEIHEMNKDIFPDPGKIRCGVRIRLPSAALLASAS